VISELVKIFYKTLAVELGSDFEVGLRFSNDFVLTHPNAAILINLDNVYLTKPSIELQDVTFTLQVYVVANNLLDYIDQLKIVDRVKNVIGGVIVNGSNCYVQRINEVFVGENATVFSLTVSNNNLVTRVM